MNTKTWFFLLTGLACNSENAAKIVNSAPEATITVPSDGDALMEGETVFLRGTVSDNNHANDELTASWSSGAVPLCPSTTPESDGTVQCEIVVFEDLSEITLSVLDPSNQIGLDTVTVTTSPTDAPTINVLSPQSTEVYYSDQLIFFAAQIGDSEDAPEELTTVWNSDIDGDLPFTALPDTNGQIEQYLYLSEGQHALTATVSDTSGKTASETVAIGVGGPNVEPDCEITDPLGGSSYVYGQNIQFVGTATDENINNSLLSISWESSIDGVFSTVAANSEGELTVVYDLLDVGNHVITLTVQDEVGGLCTDTVAITVSTPPTLTLTAPTANSVHTLGDAVVFTGTVADQEDILSDISISWSSDIDGTFSTTGADSNGSISFSYSELSAGLHNIYVTATDTSGLTSATSLPLLINTPPDQPLLTITPDPATTLDGLAVTISGSTDADGDPVTYTHEWRQNGNPTSYASSSVPMTATAAQEEWTVLVTPNDGHVDGTTAEASIIVSNSPPSVDNVGITPSNFTNDETIHCTATATDADQNLTPNYLWTVGSLTFSGSSLDLSTMTVMPGEPIICTASVVDAFGEQAELSVSSSATNRPPIVGSVSITPAQAFTNSPLECLGSATDPDGETPTMTIEWLVGGNVVGSGSTINLNNTLVSVGDTVSCTITATDAMLETNVGTATISVDNTDPTIVDMTLTPTNPTEIDVLNCAATTADIDGNTPITTFEWQNLTTGVTHASTSSSATTATLDLSLIGTISPNDELTCTLTVDDTDGGVVSQTVQVTVTNTPPLFTSTAVISPTTGLWAGTTVTCDAQATDSFDGPLTPTYEWSANGATVASGATYVINHADVAPSQSLTCTATVTDSGNETAQSTDSVQISNAPPEITSVTLSPTTPGALDTITATVVTNDPNGDAVTAAFEWTVDGVAVQSGPENFLTPTVGLHSVGEQVVVTVSATDGTDSAQPFSSQVDVVNTPPSISNMTLTPSSPNQNDLLNCTASVDDADGNTPITTFDWQNQTTGVGYSSTSSTTDGATLDLSSLTSVSPNDEIVCTLTVDDTNGGVVSQSALVTVINSAPQFTIAATISPTTNAWAGTLMTCDAEAADLVDGTITPTYEWSVNGVVIATGPTYTVDHADVVPTQTLVCTATATDSDSESTLSTDSVDIVNAPPEITSVTLSPASPNAENTITATVVTNDLNGDTVTLGFNWDINGTPVQSGPDNFLTPTVGLHTFGDVVTVTVGANDGTDSAAMVSSSVNVANAPPTDPTIDLSPSSPIENSDDLVCTVTGPSTDPDGTTPIYEFQWMIDGVNNFYNATDSLQSSTVDRSYTVAGDVWTCTVLATDGNDSSNPVSLSVTVAPDGGEDIFDFTGNVETFTVPGGVTLITIEAYGGQGGNGTNGIGGPGGYVRAEGIPVVPGDSYEIRVGGQGQSGNGAPGGYFDGGAGANGSAAAYGGGGGGGSSDIRPSGGGLGDRIVVAGGGGGGGGDGCNAQGLTGGSGGGVVGGSGDQGNGCVCNPSGTGGTETSGGDVGAWACGSNCNAQAGGFGFGGNGNTSSSCGGTTGGGGGGGGWYGGGGGGLGAGGGGSSYATSNASAVTHSQGVNSGNGQIIISW